MKKALTISVIIPVYNEERHLRQCLEALSKQTVPADEVIVVDNNSTDKTAAIAATYPFVKLISEHVQGLIPARNAGFAAAKGDILGRLDGDSIPRSDWVQRLHEDFADERLMGVTGLARTHTLPRIRGLYTTIWSRVYFWGIHAFFDINTLWGANMAIRRTAWLHIRDRACPDDALVHEDQDISLLIAGNGGKLKQDNQLQIMTTGQSYMYWPKFIEYNRRRYATKRRHQELGTLSVAEAQRLGFWHTLPGRLFCVAPALLFFVASFLFWPIDALAIRLTKNPHGWLD